MTTGVSGPISRYFGGKWRVAPWIVAQFPPHSHYTEVFGGAASVLLRKPRVSGEVYNDLSEHVVNLFRVLRDPMTGSELCRRIELTPFSRSEFFASKILPTDDPIERARKFLVIAHLRYGTGAGDTPEGEGFRSSSKKTFPAVTFAKLPTIAAEVIERFRGVVIENLPAVEVLKKHDLPGSLHYVDPPYVHDTRTSSHGYLHEMDDDEHRELCDVLLGMRGRVVVSNYANPIYDEAFAGWNRHERKVTCEKGLYRFEVLWVSPEKSPLDKLVDLL